MIKTEFVTKTNEEATNMLLSMQDYMDTSGIVGFAIARNCRKIADELKEFTERRDALIKKYGEKEIDENGLDTGNMRIKVGSEAFEKFNEDIKRYASIKITFELMIIGFKEVIEVLKAKDIVKLSWMIDFDSKDE